MAAKLRAELAEVQKDIALYRQLQPKMPLLLERAKTLEECICRAEAPAWKMPHDVAVLGLISEYATASTPLQGFATASPDGDATESFDPADAFKLTLMLICRHWRNVVQAKPSLWQSIGLVLPVGYDSDAHLRRAAKKLDLFTQRANGHPTNVRLHWRYRAPGVTQAAINILFKALQRNAPSIEVFQLDLGEQNLDSLAAYASKASHYMKFTRLRELVTVLYAGEEYENQDDIRIPIFTNAPELRHVYLDALSPSSLFINWGRITKFEADNFTLDKLLYVLKRAESLESADIQIVDTGAGHPPVPANPFAHQALRHLVLSGGSVRTVGKKLGVHALEYFSAPGLVTLEISDSAEYNSQLTLAVVSAFFSSLTRLETLSLGHIWETEFVELCSSDWQPLAFLVRLNELKFNWIPSQAAEGLFSELTSHRSPAGKDKILLPCLAKLEINWDVYTLSSILGRSGPSPACLRDIIHAAAKMLQKRNQNAEEYGIRELKLISNAMYYNLDESDLDPFKDLRVEGIDILVKTACDERRLR